MVRTKGDTSPRVLSSPRLSLILPFSFLPFLNSSDAKFALENLLSFSTRRYGLQEMPLESHHLDIARRCTPRLVVDSTELVRLAYVFMIG